MKSNWAYPLLKYTFSILGSSRCEVLMVLFFKRCIPFSRTFQKFKKLLWMLPYSGSTSYLYWRVPMGFNISPLIWKSYINMILDCLWSRKYCEAIMDGLLLFTPTKKSHIAKLEDLLKALPKKCLQYIGNTIFVKDRRVCVRPLRSRLKSIQKLKPSTTVKGCRSFPGMVNF